MALDHLMQARLHPSDVLREEYSHVYQSNLRDSMITQDDLRSDTTYQKIMTRHLSVKKDIDDTLSAKSILDSANIDEHYPVRDADIYSERKDSVQRVQAALQSFVRCPGSLQVLDSKFGALRSALHGLNDSAAANQIRLKTMTQVCVEREIRARSIVAHNSMQQQQCFDTQSRNKGLLGALMVTQRNK